MVATWKIVKKPPLLDFVGSWIAPAEQPLAVKFTCRPQEFAECFEPETGHIRTGPAAQRVFGVEMRAIIRDRARENAWFIGQEHTDIGVHSAVAGRINIKSGAGDHGVDSLYIPTERMSEEYLLQMLSHGYSRKNKDERMFAALIIMLGLTDGIADLP